MKRLLAPLVALVKPFARGLLRRFRRHRHSLAQQLLAELGDGDCFSRRWRWFEGGYLVKRWMQESLGHGPPRGTGAYVAWRREIRTEWIVKLTRWSDTVPGTRPDPYPRHRSNQALTQPEADRLRDLAQQLRVRPLFSIVVPVYNAEPAWLDRLFGSIAAQTYDRFELLVQDDGSSSDATAAALAGWSRREPRLRLARSPANGGIADASNRAAARARGDFLVFVDHDDELLRDALWCLARGVNDQPDCDLLYTDEEFVPETGEAPHPAFKPGFSPELLLAYNYICHLLVVRRDLFAQVRGFRAGTDGAQDYDLLLRLLPLLKRVVHMPRVLYRWHIVPRSVSRFQDPNTGKPQPQREVAELTRRVVQEHLDRSGILADCQIVGVWAWLVFRPVDRGKVTIIICTRDQPRHLWRAVRSIERRTDYPNYEILIVDNGSRDWLTKRTLGWLGRRHRVVRMPSGPAGFNWSRLNNAAATLADGDYLLFLNDDVEVRSRQWLSALVGMASLPGVGAAGARLLYPDDRIQHAGVILGAMGWGPWHALMGLKTAGPDAFGGFANFPRNCIAATGACLMTRRQTFLDLGGFDGAELGVSFSDVDYCLRLQQAGWRCAYVPQAELIHDEGQSRGMRINPAEAVALKKRTQGIADPFWNPNRARHSHLLAISSRRQARGVFPQNPPKVLVVTQPERGDGGWPTATALFAALDARRACTSNIIVADHNGWTSALADELASGDWEVVFVQGWSLAAAIEVADRCGRPALLHVPDRFQSEGPWTTASAARMTQCLRAARTAYQVVFANPDDLSRMETGFGLENAALVEATLLADPLGVNDDVRQKYRRMYWQASDEVAVVLMALESHPSETLAAAWTGLCRAADRRPGRMTLVVAAPFAGKRRRPRLRAGLNLNVSVHREPLDLGPLMAAADVFLGLAGAVSRPLAALRALHSGLPIVADLRLARADLVQDGTNGFICATNRPDEWAAALGRLADDAALRRRMGAASRHWLASRASPEWVLDQWASLLREAAELRYAT